MSLSQQPKSDLGLLAAPPSTQQTLSLVSSPELADFIKEDFTQDVVTLKLKDLLVMGCELGVDKQSWALVRLITLFIWQIYPDMSGNMQMCKMTINGDVRR